MQRTFQRSNAGGDGGVNIGQRSRHDARRKGRSVQLVIGVQSESDVEHMLHHVVRLLAGERIEEVGREAQLGIAFQHRLAGSQTIERGDDGRRLRHQARRLLDVRLGGVVARFRIVQPQHRYRRAQHVHGRAFGHLPQKLDHFLGNRPVSNQLRLERVQFRLLRQLAVPKQVDHFLKLGVFGQGMDIETLVTQDPEISIDETNIRLGGNNPLESRLCNWH